MPSENKMPPQSAAASGSAEHGRDAVPGRDAAQLREELRVIEDELTGLRSTVTGLREQIGNRSDGARDPAELAAALTAVEEQEALIGVLERRRIEVRRQLGAG